MKIDKTTRDHRNGIAFRVRLWRCLATLLVLAGSLAGRQSQAQTVIPPASKVTPDASKPGFIWRVFANSANQENSIARADAALAGLLTDTDGNPLPNLADPTSQGAAIAPGLPPNPENASIDFLIESTINLSQTAGTEIGNFTPDAGMPGIPATDGSTDGIAADIITYLELPAGTITMGVNSNDGFRTTAGDLSDVFRGIKLGNYEGGRGSADSIFTFEVTEAGVYPFKTTYEQGSGDANIEWFTIQNNVKVLVNNTVNGGLKAFRAATVPPRDPYIKNVSPEPGLRQLNKVATAVVVVLADGDDVAIDDSTINFKVDGAPVTDKKREGKTVTLTYPFAGIQFPAQSHAATLTFKGVGGGFTRTESWGFKNIKNVILPSPVLTENFDSYPEGSQPSDWVATNFTAPCNDSDLIQDQESTPYLNWVVISTGTIPFVDSAGVNDVNATETVNGQPLTLELLRSGKVLYAESEGRCNGGARADVVSGVSAGPYGQTQFIVTKAYNLSAVKDPVLSLGVGYMQNQDSFGGMEYSVDGGVTFLPIVYYLDQPVIVVAADGTTDGMATLTAIQPGETSVWVANGVVKGQAFGDAAAAPINVDIGNYIVPRINDNGAEGKRIEIFRLPAASQKSDVRLRLAATGSDSWYFFVDNIAFYDISTTGTVPPTLSMATNVDGSLTLTYPGVLQSSANLGGPFASVLGASSPFTVRPAEGPASQFYRAAN